MLRRSVLIASACLALTIVSQPAAAAPITIGVRGFEVASVPLGDTSFQSLGNCSEFLGLGEGFLCVPYRITPEFAGGVFSVDLTFQNVGGTQISPIDVSQLVLGKRSDFTELTVVDPFTIKLHGGRGELGEMLCGTLYWDFLNNPSTHQCVPGYDVVVFFGPGDGQQLPEGPFEVAMTAVNVPEPAIMSLMGLGMLFAGRSLRRAKQR